MRLTTKLRSCIPSTNPCRAVVWAGVAVALTGCSAQYYEDAASRQTKKIIFQKASRVPNVDPNFKIEEVEFATLDDLPENSEAAEYLGKVADLEDGAKILDLNTALEMAIEHNRTYLTQKESIYLEALDLTLIRFELEPVFRGEFDLSRSFDAAGVIEAADVDVEGVSQRVEQQVDRLVAVNTVTRRQSVGVNWLLRTGAQVSADLTSDFLRFMMGDRSVNNSALVVNAVQPLLKNAGTLATTENLTQAERNLLYSLRDFANFRREFIVEVVGQYYGVLEARDVVNNSWIAYQGFLNTFEREQGMAEEGKRTVNEMGQLQQALLQSESSWINSVLDYENRLDAFKIELGLPVDEPFVLKEEEIAKLKIEDPKISRDEAVEIALVTRPDLVNVKDRIEDANRRIEVAKVDLRPGLDLVGEYSVLSEPGDTTPDLRADRRRWTAGIELDLPFDRRAERNFYRSTLIELERAKREELLAVDRVKLQIFQTMRDLEQAKRNFEISELGVKVALKRLEEQELLFEINQGEARDLIEARIDLIDAQNQRTSTIIGHTLARLRLWRDMGVLYVNEDGTWETRLAAEGTN